MRFAVPDEDEDLIEAPSPASSTWRSTQNRAGPSKSTYITSTPTPSLTLGKRYKAYADSSDSEIDDLVDSEDEVEMMGLDESWEGVKMVKKKQEEAWREAGPASYSSGSRPISRKGKERFNAIMEIIDSEPNEYEAWVKITEEAAWKEGRKIAHSRRAELREIALNAKAEMREEQSMQAAHDAEEMRKMLEGLAIQQSKEEEEARRVFKEREKRLWADIDAAIKRAEKLEAEKRNLELAAEKRKAEEAAAKKQAAEQASATAKAETERLARETAEKARAEELAKAQAAQEEEKKKEDEAAKKKAAEQRGVTGATWKEWTERQREVKREVIERAKTDGVRSGLRGGMRLITRGLGQVVNTKESVVRVTHDIHNILTEHLPSPPSPGSPTLLTTPPPIAYTYLLSHLSKALIKQAESEVSAKPDAAFPLARIILGLLLRGHAAFGHILFSRLVKKCPWVIPFYPSRQPNQPREEYEKSTGRGPDESLSDYINRMAGITTLYFSILQTPLSSLVPTVPTPPTPDQLVILIPPVLRLPAAWSWLSHALRDPMPALPPVAHLLAVWIEVCGVEVAKVYGRRQVGKVYEAIMKEGVKGGQVRGDSEAAKQKLGILLEGWETKGEPEGRNWE